jgi:selenide,water dikinase
VAFDKGVDVMQAFNLLPDPQTNGGLLIAVKESALQEVQGVLGMEAIPIGKFVAKADKAITVKHSNV